MVRVSLLVLVGAVMLGTAGAQPAPNPEGARLFEEGRTLAKEGKWAEACDKFAKSLEFDPAIGTQLNYADCHEHLGQYAEAWRLFDGAADAEKMTNPTRAKFARERADSLLPKVGVIVLRLATPDAPMLAVSISGRTLKAAPVIKEIVNPGQVQIAVTAASGTPFQKTETVGAGKSITIDVPAFGDTPTTGGGGGLVGGPGDSGETQRRRSRVYISYAVTGAGAIALGVGIGLGLSARSKYNAQFDNGQCMDVEPRPICEDAGFKAQTDAVSRADLGTVFGATGLVLVAGGAVLFLTAPRDLVVTPTATTTSAGLSVVGNF